MKKTIIINIVASPCAGKSTLACDIFSYLKKSHYDVEYVNEFAKILVWQDKFDDLNNQYYVSSKQYKMIKSIYGKVDYIICDSPLILGLFYNYYNKYNICDKTITAEYILNKMEEFPYNKYIFIKRNKNIPYITSGRLQNESESNFIESCLLELLHLCDINYTLISTGDNIDNIINSIL